MSKYTYSVLGSAPCVGDREIKYFILVLRRQRCFVHVHTDHDPTLFLNMGLIGILGRKMLLCYYQKA